MAKRLSVEVGNKEVLYMDSDVQQLTLFMQNVWQIISEKRAEVKLQFPQFAVEKSLDAVFWIGLGLTIAKDLVEKRQGEISVTSEPG